MLQARRNAAWAASALALILFLALAGCGGDEPAGEPNGSGGDAGAGTEAGDDLGTIKVYNGRGEQFMGPFFGLFEDRGAKVEALTAGPSDLLRRLIEEKDSPQADLFISKDAATLEEARRQGLLESLPTDLVDRVPERFRGADNGWVGASFRCRVLVYNTDLVDEPPTSVLALTDPEWKGKVARTRSGNGSFESHVGTIIADYSERTARMFLEGLDENTEGNVFPKHTPIVTAVAEGRVEVGLVNHYYVYRHLADNPDAPIDIVFPDQGVGSEGTAWNVAGVGLVRGAKNREAALAFIELLLSDEGQKVFAETNYEYPVVPGVDPAEGVRSLDEVELSDSGVATFADQREKALRLIQELGLE